MNAIRFPNHVAFLALAVAACWTAQAAQAQTTGPKVATTQAYLQPAKRPVAPATYEAAPARPHGVARAVATQGGRNPYAQQASFGLPGERTWTGGYVPQRGGVAASYAGHAAGETIMEGDPAIVSQGMVYGDPAPAPGEYGGCQSCGGGSGEFGDCASCGEGADCGQCGHCGECQDCLIPCPRLRLENFEFFSGVQGFKGTRNAGDDGSFGFHYGFNYGNEMPCSPIDGLSMQFGVNVAHSNLSGVDVLEDQRDQVFLTGGLFRRVDWGLQGGVVYDYLKEDWYNEVEVTQLRGEISWLMPCTHELGFWFATAMESDVVTGDSLTNTNTTTNVTWDTSDIYAFFYRRRFASCEGAIGRFYGGFTDESDGIVGADIRVPVNHCWALDASFNYLIPEEASDTRLTLGTNNDGTFNEAWNVGFHLVWTPQGHCGRNPYNRPLLPVADNGSLLLNRRILGN